MSTDCVPGDVRARIKNYYDGTLSTFGPTARGVDWDSCLKQALRFAQLMKSIDVAKPFSLNDLGCGYGALFGFLLSRCHPEMIDYAGVDLSEAMIAQATQLWSRHPNATFAVGEHCLRAADYTVASGIFNVKLGCPDESWTTLVADGLTGIHQASRLGFAVNLKLDTGAPDGTGGALYRTRAAVWTGFCQDRLGVDVEVLSGYGLDEFTLVASPKRASAERSSLS